MYKVKVGFIDYSQNPPRQYKPEQVIRDKDEGERLYKLMPGNIEKMHTETERVLVLKDEDTRKKRKSSK